MRRQRNKRTGLKSTLFSRPARTGLWHHDLGIEPLEQRHLLAATVTSTTPDIFTVPDLAAGTKALKVVYSLDVAHADQAGNYELLGSGGDGDFTNGNELLFDVAATYPNPTTASLTFATLPVDHYRFSIHAAAITDVVDHLPLDGDADGTAGGDFVKTFAIVPGQGSKMTVSGFPTSTTAGTAGSISVTILDGFDNVATGYTGTLQFSSNDTQAVLPADYTFTAADHGTKVFPVTLRTVGSNRSIKANDPTPLTGFSSNQLGIIVTPAAASTFVVSGFAATNAGSAKTFSIAANDPYGNRDTNYTGTVHFTSSDPQATLPLDYTFTTADAGIKSRSATLRTAGAQSLTVTDTALGFSGTQTGIPVSPLATARFVTSGFPSPATAAVAGVFSVAAVDTHGNATPSYLGTVHFTSTDVAAVLPPDYTFVAGDAGVKSFSATLSTLGSRTITATDTVTGSIFGSQSAILVQPGAASTVQVSLLPASTTAGAAQNFRIDIRDANGFRVPNYAGTVHFTSSDPLAVLPADYTMTAADGGNRTFAVTFKTAGPQSITATATDAASAVVAGSGSTSVAAAIAKSLSVVGFTTTTIAAGTPSTFTVTARDAYGNQAPSYTGTVKFTSTDLAAILPADYTFGSGDQGSATFSATLLTSGSRTITATDTSDASILGKQQGIAVTPATATSFVVNGLASTSAGTVQAFVVAVYDVYGNLATNYTGTVHVSSSDPLATLPADYSFTATDAGHKTFSATLRTAGNQSVTVTDTALGVSGAQTGILISPLAATRFVTSGFPTPATIGVAGQFTVRAADTFGNTATSYLGTVHFTSTDALATLPADYQFTVDDAGVKTFSATLKTLGSRTITATDTSSGIFGSQSAILVQAGAVARVDVSLLPDFSSAGVSENFRIDIRDANGFLVPTYAGTVHFTSSDPLAVLPADYSMTAANGGTRTFSVTFKTAGPQTVTATATDASSNAIVGTGGTTVLAAAATSLSVGGFTTPTVAGEPGTFTVTARDLYGNVAPSYTGTVRFTSTDLAAVLPGSFAFQSGDQGSATFPATLVTAGVRTITATDESNGAILGKQQGITVTAAAASSFVVSNYPATDAGTSHNFVVTAHDAYGNRDTNYTGTIHFTSSDPLATLPADFTFTEADLGNKTFSATLRTAGSQSLTATDTSLEFSGTQSGISVSPLAATQFVTSGFPSPTIAGVPGTFTVAAVDTHGNIATSYLGTVTFASSDPLAALPADYEFTAADAGVKSFTATLSTVGLRSITATDTVSGIVGTQATIAVETLAASILGISGLPDSSTAGIATQMLLNVRDALGNTVPTFTGTIHFTSSDPLAVLPADYTFTAADAGDRVFSATFKTAGPQTITATAVADATLTGSGSLGVVAAAAKTLSVGGFATHPAAGTPGTLTVTARDAYGNQATSYTGTVSFTSTDPAAVLPPNYTFGSSDAGSATFSATLLTAGTWSITVTDTSDATILGKQQGITVTPAIASTFVLSGLAAANAGTAQSFVLMAYDAFGNKNTGYTGTVHFSSTDPLAVLPADYTFTAADAGDKTLSATLRTAGSQSLTATDTTLGFSSSQTGIVISPLAASRFVTSGFPSPCVAGTSGAFTVAAVDIYSNSVPNYAGTVHFTSTDPLAALPVDYTFTAADAGIKSFSATLFSMGSRTITATDTSSGIFGSQSAIAVQAGIASTFDLAALPASIAAGVSQNFTLNVRDTLGNLVTGYTGTVHFVSSDPLAVLPADYAMTLTDAGNRTFSVTFKTAGPQTITAIATADATLTGSAATNIAAAVAKTFSVTGFATATVAGTPGTFTVAARDAYDNPTPNYTGTVFFTSTDLSAVLPASYTFTTANQGTATFSATLVSAGVRTITVTDISDVTILGKQQGIVVTAGAASYMVIDAPTPVNAGTPFAVTVSAKDAHGNLATAYTGTIHFATPLDENSTLPLDYTFTAADAGTHTFSVTMQASGSQSIDVVDTVNATITGHQGAIRVLAPQYRYAASSNNIYVTGPVTVTLSDIKAALPSAPLQLVDPLNGIWMLKANLVMNDGATLLLHGTSIGGDVNELRLKSNNVVELNGTGKPNNFIFVQAFWGTLNIDTTKITSWNEAANSGAGGPDTETDVHRRAFIRALSFEENGIAYESRMDIKNSDIGYLGSHDAESYGLTWKVRGGTPELIAPGDFSIYDRVDVFGDVLNNRLHHNYFAIYTFGAYGMLIDNNKVYNNIGYGIDPHDDSDYLVISNNESYNNGWHGIIASQRCDHIQIINNSSHDNGKHGIMLHRGSDYGLIANNTSYNNGEHGIALFNNFYTEVRDNVVYNNLAGIRLSVGSAYNTIHDNLVYNNLEAGIKFFQGSDLPSDGEEYVDATGRPTANVFEHNTILGNGRAIELSNADLNVFRNNTFGDYVTITSLGTTTRQSGDMVLTDAIDNVFQNNTMAANIVLSTRSESGEVVSKSHVIGTAGMKVKVDATSSVYFDDPSGRIFDVLLPGIGTTVIGTGSKLSLAAAQIGNQFVQVLPRNLTATTGAAQTLNVDVTEWTTTGNNRKVWTAKSGSITQSATYTAGDLAANTPYAILKNGALLRVSTSNAAGKLSFSDVAGTTSPVAYSVVASVTQFFISGNLNVTAGISQAITVQYSPASGVGAAGYRGKVHFTSSDIEAELPDDYRFTATDAGKHTFTVQFKTAGPQTITVTEIAIPTITGTSLPTLVAPAAATSFSVLGFTQPIVAGFPGTVKVIAKDVFDNIATGYLGTVRVTASSGAVLPANYTFTAADQGIHYFPVTFTTAGTKFITVTDTVTASIVGSQVGIVVGQAPVAGFVATGLTAATAGTSAPVTIRVVDASGNTVTSNTTRVHFTSTDPLAVLPADYTYSTSDAGVRTFNVQFRTAGPQTLTVNLVSNPTIRRVLPPTTVSPAAASTLSVTGFPAAINVGVPGTFTVTARDAFGNVATGYRRTVTFSGTSGVTLPANYTFTAADQGVRTFTATFTTTGTKSLTARDTATSSITGTQSGITVNAVPPAALTVTGSASVTAGGSASITVRILNSSGGTLTSFTGKVHFTSTDPQATLPADYTFTASDAGVRTFTVPLKTAGVQSIAVNVVGTPAINATLSNIAVAAAATSKFTWSGFPTAVTAGAVVPVTVTARDQYNNITPAYRGIIRFTSDDSQAVLPGNYAYTAADNGQHTFNITLRTSGTQSVTATSTASSSINGSQSVRVNAAVATVLRVYNFPSTVDVGETRSFTVRFYDAYGNTATGFIGTVTFSSNDPLATLPATYTFTAADAGRRNFNATLRSIGTNRTITATQVGGTGLTGTQTSIRVR